MEIYNGYWGSPNSIMDFCEPNYAVSYYFAEFFNTLSSMPMIIQAILGLLLTHIYATKEIRYKLCFISLMFVGVGSSLFHASLRYKYQLLDELPMLLLSAVTLFCTLTISSTTTKTHHLNLMILLIGITLLECALYIYFKIWSVFFIGYSLNVVIVTIMLIKYHLHGIARKYFIVAWLCYYGGFSCWCIDMICCDYVQMFQLHSFWHLAAGYGSYLTFIVLILIRSKYLRKQSEIYVYKVSDLLCVDNIKIDIPLVHYCRYNE